MAHSWLRDHPRLRLWLRGAGAAAVAGALSISSYEALSAPSREAHQVRRELQRDATSLCHFVSGVHDLVTLVTSPQLPPPVSPLGESFLVIFRGLGRSAAEAVASPLCVPAGVSVTPSPPPTGRPSR